MSVLSTVIICIGCFIAGVVALAIIMMCLYNKRNRKKKPPKHIVGKEKKDKKSVGTMNLILVIIGVTLAAFTICMIDLFKNYGMVPDTLITCVFAALAGECGIMGWIKTTKDKKKEREWMLEDEKRMREEQQKEKNSGSSP